MTDHPLFSRNNVAEILRLIWQQKKKKNKQFSIRRWAQMAGINHALLSQILSEKRRLAPKTARKIAVTLGLTENEQKIFILKTALEHAHRNEKAYFKSEAVDSGCEIIFQESTFLMSQSSMPEAKRAIRDFHQRMRELFETSEGDRLVHLHSNLFPVVK